MRISVWTLAASLMVSAGGVTAQQAGTVEVGGFAQLTGFDEHTTLTTDNAWGAGGLLGVFLMPNLALEGAVSRSWTEDASPAGVDGTWTPIRGRLVYAIPASDRFYPLLGAGVVRNDYSDAVDGSDTGITGLIGLKGYVSDRVAIRSDLQLDYMWSPFNEGAAVAGTTVSEHTNWTVSTGLSIDLGRGRVLDRDGDGVPDRGDLCLTTPMGVAVNADGCRLDTDGDGIFEEADRCAGTPRGVRVDATGCRVDTDGDGVYDEDDSCSNTPSGVRVDASGCRVDTDGDGVFDEADRCAATPRGVSVDATGCRVDTDGDGVFNEDDQCPASPRGEAVDARGCPVLFEPETASIVLEGVNFETNSAQLTDEAQVILNRVAESLVGNPEIRVRVIGHTDSTGSRAYNTTLSQSRAEAVAAYLAQRGVAGGRMQAQGLGPDRPMATNDTAAGRLMNRRVELERIN